jgi:hypothetical protein
MRATELIREVAALSPAEKTLFAELYHAMKNGRDGSGSARPSNWPDFDERLRGIYGDKIAPDSQMIIEEGRGDH